MSERVNNYSRYVKEMYYPKTSQAKHDEIENIISKLKINMSNDSLSARGSPDGIRKSNSILKLREVKSSLATPTYRSGKNSSALKTLDKYAVAVKSILEQRGENGEMLNDKEKLNWYKKNPMVKDKYVPPQPTQYHDNTLLYLDELRDKRKNDG